MDWGFVNFIVGLMKSLFQRRKPSPDQTSTNSLEPFQEEDEKSSCEVQVEPIEVPRNTKPAQKKTKITIEIEHEMEQV